MSTDATLLLFTAVVAIAVALQAAVFWGIYRSIRVIAARVDALGSDVQDKLAPLATRTEELLAIARPALEQFQAIQQHVSATTELVHRRVVDLDGFLHEATDSARLQVARIQDLVDTTSSRVEDTVEQLQRGVLAPLIEVSALLRGIRVGLDFFFRGGRRSRQAHQDDEMFI